MQGDGNLVEYGAIFTESDGSWPAFWASNTSGSGNYAIMQGDGNLVVYDASGDSLWASNTSGNPDSYLTLTDSGFLIVTSASGAALWGGSGVLASGARLDSNQSVVSPDGYSALVMQSDGNLVEYHGDLSLGDSSATASWASNTSGSGNYAIMQGDGNLVVYSSSNAPLWASNTSGNPGAYLTLDSSGLLTVNSDSGTALWGGAGILVPGEQLTANQTITGPVNGFTLTMQGDGNLVEYDGPTVEWASNTSGSGNYAIMQGDGNFVVYSSSNAPLWVSNTSGNPGADLVINDDGNLIVQSANEVALWNDDFPTISSVSPSSGSALGGVSVTVRGTGFSSAIDVLFGQTPIYDIVVISNTELEFVAPATSTGSTAVRVYNDYGLSPLTSADQFTTVDPSQPCTDVWTGDGNSSWGDPTNWSQDSTPSVEDSVCIPLDSSNLPVQLTSTATVTSVENDGGLVVHGSLGVVGPSQSTSNGSLTIDGTLSVTGSFTASGQVDVSEGGSLTGPGSLAFASSSLVAVDSSQTNCNEGISCISGGLQVINDGVIVLEDNAQIGIKNDGSTLNNFGSMHIGDGSQIIQDGGGSSQVVNEPSGTMEYSGDGTLVFATNFTNEGTVSSPSGTFDMSGTVLDTWPYLCSTGSFCESSGGTFTGGMELTGLIDVPDDTLAAFGNLIVASEGSLEVDGELSFEQGSTLDIEDQGTNCQDLEACIWGTGNIDLYGTTVLHPNASISVLGDDTNIFNYGLIDIGDNSSLSYVPVSYAAGSLENHAGAAIQYLGTGSLDFNMRVDDNGSITAPNGTLDLTAAVSVEVGGSLTAESLDIDSGGTLTLGQGATVDVGSLSGAASVPGDYGSIYAIGAPFSEIDVSGQADLSRIGLFIWGANSFTPRCGESVPVVVANSVLSGSTDISTGGTPSVSGGTWSPWSTATSAGAYISCPVPSAPTAQTYGTGASIDSVNPSHYQAEPVNTATGAYNTTETDGQLAGLGIPFTFTRAYSSDNPYSGPLGPGWTDSMNVFLTAGSGTETLSDEDGQQTVFTSTGGGAYHGPAGSLSTLSAVSGGGWLLTRHDQDELVFSASGQLTSETDRNGIGLNLAYNNAGQLASVTDDAGRTVTFSYNGSGLLTTMSLPLGRSVSYAYNGAGELASVTDAAGGVTSYTYSAAGLLATITDQDGHQVVANTYDDSGRVVSQVNSLGKTATFAYASGVTTYTDPNGNQWQDVYDGNVLEQRIDPLGGATSYTYDANLNLLSTTDPNGNTTTYTYDSDANVLTKTTPLGETTTNTYDALNDVTSMTDPLGNETTYSYDAAGNLLSTTDPLGNTTTYVHDPTTGVVTSVADPNGHTTTYAYDSAGNLTSVTDPLGKVITYAYDGAGRRTSATNSLNKTTTYTYDALDRLTSVTNPDGDTATYAYDAVGNRTAVETPNGHTTTYTYDADNRLTSVTAPGGSTATYTYDDDGNRVSVTNGDGHATTYTYDQDNRLASVTDPLGHTTTYTYDAAGNLVTKTDALGATTTYTYDADNQLTSVAYSDATPGVTYGYDADGQRTSMTDGTGTTTYTYDADSNLLTRTAPSGTFTYSYDPDGNILTRTYPDGTTVTDTYDADDRLSSVTTNGATTTYAYSAASQLTTATLPNGVVETTTYDPAGYVASVVDKNGSSTVTSRTYTYDADGNPTTIITQAETDTYTYDAQDRVTSACYGASCANGQISYTYDAVGNRTKMVDKGATTTYTYDAANELTSSATTAGTTTYTYDADGRRIEADGPSGTTSDAWNAANELTGVTTPFSTSPYTYTYDGDGNRVSTTTAGVTTTFVYDTNGALPELVEELNGSTELRSYVWGEGLVSMNAGGSNYYVSHDALGSVIGLTSSTGSTEETFTYDPFGNALSTTLVDPNAPSIPLRFDGGYLDSTGLYSFGVRELDPTTGTFLSTDPLGENPTQPAISAYLFVGDEPTVMVDPSGESWYNPATWSRKVSDAVGAIPIVGTAVQAVRSVEAVATASVDMFTLGPNSQVTQNAVWNETVQGINLGISVLLTGKDLAGAIVEGAEWAYGDLGNAGGGGSNEVSSNSMTNADYWTSMK
jgi:RHS repeat-associated protein